jgi:alpha-beta hydrolase superfamily lysophospholipase
MRPHQSEVARASGTRAACQARGVVTWHPDFLDGYESADLPLDVPRAVGEPEDVEMVATLVRKAPGNNSRVAALYLHGFNDYFFQTHVADAFTDAGIDFFALDLRRYGRSLRRGHFPTFITDLDDYGLELGLAADVIAEDHDRLVVIAHSTGGLIASLWAASNPDKAQALVLNAPWLDLQGSAMIRALGAPVIDKIGHSRPTSVLRLPPEVGFYARVLHASKEGEWDYDVSMKTTPGPPIRVGWLRAILMGHSRVAAGLDLACPVLVMCSTATDFTRRWHEGLRSVDTVLDVEQIVQRATRLGRLVTILRVESGLHDVFLSAPAVRKQALNDMMRWLDAYVLRGA